ncbi:MAG: ABC transporter substrate-binding protein [Sporolactobacillus sp.]
MRKNAIQMPVSILLAVIMIITLSSCAQSTGTASSSSSTASNTLSGRLVIYSAGPDALIQKIAAGFAAKTGLKPTIFSSTTGKILSRVEAEKYNPDADVLILASLSSAIGLKQEGLTQPFKNAQHANQLANGWKDSGDHYFCYSGSALGIAYNTHQVKDPPKDWSDLTDPQYKNQLIMPDPTTSGSCMDFVSGYVNQYGNKAWQYFQNLKSNGMTIANSNDTALDPVLTGSKSIVVSAVDYMTLADKAKGEPINIVYPTSGTIVSPRPALILKGAKDQQNARVFINYLLSKPVQKMVEKAHLLPGRQDMSEKGNRAMNAIVSLEVNWTWMANNSQPVGAKFDDLFGVK